jgi:dynein heavy chain
LDSYSEDISEIKSFPRAPDLVQYVMESVCILLGAPDVKWATSKQLLGDPKFLSRLFNFDKDHIPEPVLKKLKKYTDNPLFDPNAVAKHSVAAKSLCMWVRAIEVYSQVYKNVEPKRIRVKEASALLEASKGKLLEKQMKLQAIEEQLSDLKKNYETSLVEKVCYLFLLLLRNVAKTRGSNSGNKEEIRPCFKDHFRSG